MRVAVLHDQVSPEAAPDLQDNLVQAKEVAQALRALGHRTLPLAFGPDVESTAAALRELAPQAVFNLVETPLGRARLIHLAPLVLERLGLAHTGAGTSAMLLTSNKLMAKRMLGRAGLPTPAWLTPPLEEKPPPIGGPWLVKSVWEHGSLGIEDDALVPVGQAAALAELLARRAAELGGEWFAEQYVAGREFNLSLLEGPGGPELLPPAEIVFDGFDAARPRLVGYRAKWQADSFEYGHTPRRFDLPAADRPLLGELGRLARASWRLFGLRGWARVDFRVDPNGRPWILEVNANPCLAADAGFAAAAARAGLDQTAVVGRILASAALPAPRRPAPLRAAGGG